MRKRFALNQMKKYPIKFLVWNFAGYKLTEI